MSEREYQLLRDGLASTRMEGFEGSAQTEEDCFRLVAGKISVNDLVQEILSRTADQVAS